MRADGPTDAALLAGASTDPEAFVEFYRRYEAAIVGFFVRRVSDPELAADLTAEVFAAASVKLRQLAWWAVDDRGNHYLGHISGWGGGEDHCSG